MTEKGISQSELSRRVGVSQSAVHKLTSGQSYSSRHLHRIARELGTTPAYLEAEIDDPEEDAPSAPELNEQERKLVECFAGLNAVQRQALLTIAQSMVGSNPGGNVHVPTRDPRPPAGVERRE